MTKITTAYKIICDNCKKDLTINEYTNWIITLDCNDTGFSSDDFELHFCNKKCLYNEKQRLEKQYSELELQEMSSHYKITQYLEREFSKEVFN